MPRLLVILGATATGKSGLAMRLAEELGAEIVNADALQVYRGLDVGTAKPTPAMRRLVPHHLLDVCEPHERFSAGRFAELAGAAIAHVHRRGKPAILVGGSGLYLRALLEGLSPLPQSDPEVRRALEEDVDRRGLPALYAELERLDPETAARLTPADRQRIVRALEVERLSGRPLSSWIRDRPMGAEPVAAAQRLGLTLPRSILYDRIADRVDKMMERGWVAEVEDLLRRGVRPEAPAFQAIGYRQLVEYLRGERSLDEAVEDIIRATRRYAKRQETWFRKEREVRWIPAEALEARIPDLLRELT
jgi:tRNA dimethylallyltransferase